MRGRAGSVPEISVSRLEILPYEHFSPVTRDTRMKAAWILAVRMASSWIACCILHIISIPFNSSDTVLRVAEAMIDAKVVIFVFLHVCFVSQIWRQNSSPGSLALFHLGNRAENFSYEPKGEIRPAVRGLVCYTAVFSVVTQRSFPLTSGEERCVTTLKTAV